MAQISTVDDSVYSELGEQELRFLEVLIRRVREGALSFLKEPLGNITTDLSFEELCKRMAVSLGLLKSLSCSTNDILIFMDCLVENFKDLAHLEVDIVVPLKNEILVLVRKMRFLRILLDFAAKRCTDDQILKDLVLYVNESVHHASFLSFFCLVNLENEITAQEWEISLLNLQHKLTIFAPGMIIELLRASKSSRSDKFQVGEIVVELVDFLLEGLDDRLEDYVKILKDGLIILITFFMDPEEVTVTDAEDGTFIPLAAITEVLSLLASGPVDKLKLDIFSLQGKIGKVQADIRKLYVPVLSPSVFDFPRTNGMGFVNFFMQNLKELVNLDRIAFAKHQVMIVHEMLLYLEPYLKGIMEFQKETDREDLKDLWRRIICLVYLAEHVISSCLIIDHPIWYDMLLLLEVIDAIKIIKIEVQMKNMIFTTPRTDSTQIPSIWQANLSNLESVVVGLKNESDSIINDLKRGTKNLHIVSIIGMPGLGKTTIAKKVYNDLSIRFHFSRQSWCCVSLVYRRRELYFDILTGVNGDDARKLYAESTDDDLAELLRKSLKGQKYLIVLDDIWDIKAWNVIRDSFPDDKNGSRIIFTSRIQDLVSQTKLNCSLHCLPLLSDEESWELFKGKLNCFPLDEEQLEMGKHIAKHCKGLPLAIVLVAGILASKDKEFWRQIECSTSSQVVSKGCMDILELSYKHLPDHLKPCFLYFGGFPEDSVVRAKRLLNLWSAEGFIPVADRENSHKIAEDYLSDLINRNLVTLEERSSIGGVKSCRIHDLLHEFCLAKIQQDNFLRRVHASDIPHSSLDPRKYENFRLCILSDWTKFADAESSGPCVRSLVLDGNYASWISYTFPYSVFKNFRLLNLLDLDCYPINGPFPEEVTSMVNLRYLAINCRDGIPSSILNLWNLENLKVSGVIKLPKTFWQMKKLRHACFGELWELNIPEDHEYGQVGLLESFSTVRICTGSYTNKLLSIMPGLRKLKCGMFSWDGVRFELPSLSFMTQLESLSINGLDRISFGDVVLRTSTLPSSIRRLTLSSFKLPWSSISKLGQLPYLDVLKLRKDAFSGRRWDVEDDGFMNLKYLELYDLNISQWTVQDEPFPSLERLTVKYCQKLGEIPSGLGDISTLKKIEMWHCSSAATTSAKEILEKQQEMGNDLAIVIVSDD